VRSLQAAGYAAERFVFPHGEQSKNMATYAALLSALAGAGLTRTDVVVALGGGVTGDMAGFAAASYLRGVRFAQIPTTLLAMVDSSVGGKTAVNLPEGKNLAGAFYQPDVVICDPLALETLPDEVFRDGCAEMIKHGVIADAELFTMLMAGETGGTRQGFPRMEDILARNVTVKRDIVAGDERDTGKRQLLNFGHTIGHGIEKLSGYSVTHGSAVATGMVIAGRGAALMGLCGKECPREIAEAVKLRGLPYETDFSPEHLIEAAFYDKKRRGERISIVLPERIGKCVLKDFSMDRLAEFIRLAMRA
jgi:3-dehydroquinate synthase